MTDNLKILFAASECAPFAKTGGLGDVVGSLPVYLKKLGHDVRIVIPKYSFIEIEQYQVKPFIYQMIVPMGDTTEYCSVFSALLEGLVPVYFIEHEDFYNRYNIYHDREFRDYEDNPKRFSFLSKAALQLCIDTGFKPDIAHAHDWHTAIIPAFIKKINYNNFFDNTASVLTIHNIAYQGRYSKFFYNYTGLSWEDFKKDIFEENDAVNFLKGGIHYADMVNTVSKGYADETKTPSGGFGLDYFLNIKDDNYTGILNGADYSHWNPATDKMIPANYSVDNFKGKYICKEELQKKFGLNQLNRVPVVGIVNRFVQQKGMYLLTECIEGIVNNMDVQFAILGTGDLQLEGYYGNLPQKYRGRIGAYIGYSNELAHLVEAGSDFFLMPSLYEPCGLNQIYSMKYGTLPIVRATGGLNETVENYNQVTGEGTGFKFREPSSSAIYNTVKWALETYFYRDMHFKRLIQNAMKQHFSWDESAAEYVKLYNKAIQNRLDTGIASGVCLPDSCTIKKPENIISASRTV